MEYVILGFLCLRDLSQYDILKALERKVSPFYSASLGSIQTRLKKLEQLNLITCTKSKENKRGKNLYSINDAGRKHFTNWMMADINDKKLEAQISSKVFFLGLLEHNQRIQVVEGFIKYLSEVVKEFNDANIEAQKTANSVDSKYRDILYFQLKTLDLGISEYEDLLKWCKSLLEDINKQK